MHQSVFVALSSSLLIMFRMFVFHHPDFYILIQDTPVYEDDTCVLMLLSTFQPLILPFSMNILHDNPLRIGTYLI